MPQDTPNPTRFEATEISTSGSHVATLALRGQLDAHTAPDFEHFLETRVRDKGYTRLVLDFSELEYISSAGLGVLMGLIEEIRSRGGDIKLARLPEKIFHVLDLLGFPLVFEIFPTVEEAESKFPR